MKYIPLKYGSEKFPKVATIDLEIDISDWCIGIRVARFENLCRYSIDWHIDILCFKFRFVRFFEDMERRQVNDSR